MGRGQNSEIRDINDILNEREATHGDFKTQAWVSQELKAMLRNGPNWSTMTADKREALEMVCHKMSRIVCGKDDFDDSWRDICGYVTLVLRTLS